MTILDGSCLAGIEESIITSWCDEIIEMGVPE